MTFILIAAGLWLLTAFFTWALCRAAARADNLADDVCPVDEEGRR